MIHLDTHVVLWLFLEQVDRFPPAAKELLETEDLAISPMVALELEFLHEIGRLARRPGDVVAALASALGMTTATAPFPVVVAHAARLTWTRDPFDRLIAGQALAEGARLLTADETIRANCDAAVWDVA